MLQPAPKLLFHYPVLNRGGAERSLLRLSKALVDRGCEVHLVLTSKGGVLESDVDPRIRLHHLRNVRASDTSGLGLIRWVVGQVQEFWSRRKFKRLEFDAAFAGLAGLSPRFICDVASAKRRFVFVRNDPRAERNRRWSDRVHAFGDRIDGYVCVSDYTRDAMAEVYPQIQHKLMTVYNLLDKDGVCALAAGAADPFPGADGRLRVLTVCRLQESSKALTRMVEVHRRLLDSGLAHVWYVVGAGPDRRLLENAVSQHEATSTFKLLGAVSNPYPYYLYADICAVLSRHEGLCGVVNEARILERAVIATRFSGIDEQLRDGVNGLIVDQDVDAICAGMTRLLQDSKLRNRLASGGYPSVLLDDDAKVDAILALACGDAKSINLARG